MSETPDRSAGEGGEGALHAVPSEVGQPWKKYLPKNGEVSRIKKSDWFSKDSPTCSSVLPSKVHEKENIARSLGPAT